MASHIHCNSSNNGRAINRGGADRNLLLGILAWQMGFVSRDDLLAAMHAWLAEKHRPLGDILVRHGALSEPNRQLLDSLVDAHVRQHGDIAESLAAVDTPRWLFDDLLSSADRDVRETVHKLRPHAAPPPSETAGQSTLPYHSTTEVDSSPGRYRKLELVARGGLGTVWLAEDQILHRRVALKQIRPDRTDPDHRDRFQLETEIGAGLEHPNIVPLHDGGHDAQGQPFCIMRFIQGTTLASAIREFHGRHSSPERAASGARARRTLSGAGRRRAGGRFHSLAFRDLLGRFVPVCHAVAYAHSRGIIHRDLKPGNIMLGEYGQTLVIDWGLAKPLEHGQKLPGIDAESLHPVAAEDSPSTLPGAAVGTPQYISPEQARGDPGDVSPASDVFGLGAILYHLLTGHAPYHGRDNQEILVHAERCNYKRPRTYQPDIPRPLEAICLKAMEPEPDRRYGSAQELAHDVERYLADEPVSAWREPLAVKAGRYVRRHQTLVTSGAVAAALAIAAMCLVVAIVLDRNERLVAANARERDARKLADENARLADSQSKLSLELLESIIFDIRAKLAEIPGTHAVRRDLLQGAVAGLEKVHADVARRPRVDRSMLIAQMQLGRMLLDIPDTEGVGSTTAAGQVYRSALALAERLQQQSPGDPLAKRDLGEALSKVGDVLRQQGKVGEAVDHYTRARRLFEELAQSAGAGQMEQRDLSVALVSEAAARVSLGQTDAAKGLLTRAIELRRELARGMDELKTPGNVEALGGLTHALLVLGDLEFDLGDHRQALGVYGEVLSIREKLAMSRPTDRGLQRELANTYERLGLTYHALHDFENAATWQKGCLEIRERLFDQDRRSTLDEFNLSVSYEHLGDLALAMGNLSLARQWYLKLFDIRSRRAGRDAQDAEAQRELAMAHERLAALEQFSGNVKAAMEHYQQDIAIYENLLRRDLTNESLKLELVRQLVKAAQLSATENLLEIAQENYRRSFELLESLPPSMRGEYTAWHLTSSIWLGQADIAQRKGRHAEALAAYEKSRELRNQFAEKFSGNPMALRLLGVAYQRLTHLALGQRRYDDAVRYLADWRELADKFHQQVESIESLLEIAMTQEYEGLLEMERGDYEKALQSFESCRELRQQALDRSPDLADVRKGLATALEQKGLALAAQGKREVALEVLQECFAMRKHLVERSGWSFETTASLIRALDLLAETEVNLVHASQAAEYYAMALEAIESFERATGQNPFTPEFAGFRTMLSRCAVLEKAAGDMEFILQQEEPLRPWLLRYRALALAQQKKFQDAVAAAEVLREIAPRQGVHLFHVARLYARLAEAVEADQGELTPGDQAQRDHFRQQALNALGQSVALGFYDGRQMERESDFARLRELAEFKELVKQAKSAPVVAPDP